MNLKEEYTRIICKNILLKKEDLSHIEEEIISIGFDILNEKINEIKDLNQEIVRLNIEIANLKSYTDNNEY
jgi:recombinational DNA repair ATPase RecF